MYNIPMRKLESLNEQEKQLLTNINIENITRVLHQKNQNTLSLTNTKKWDLYISYINPNEINDFENYFVEYMLERKQLPQSSEEIKLWKIERKKK